MKGTAMHDGMVTDGDIIADGGSKPLVGAMNTGPILDIHFVPDTDKVYIPAHDTVKPYGAIIAHQDFTSPGDLDLGAGRVDLRLADVDAWRAACDQLATTMDAAVGARLAGLAGRPPW